MGRTALHYAADVQGQLAAFVNVFAEPPDGVTPVLAQRTASELRMAADHAQKEVVAELEQSQVATAQLLLAFGASPNAHATMSGSTPLHLAARSGATAVVKLLVQHGALLEARNRYGSTPLTVAAAAGHASTCRALLGAGAQRDARNANGRTAQWYAQSVGGAMDPADAVKLFGACPVQSRPPTETHRREASALADGGWGTSDNQSALLAVDVDICDIDRHQESKLTATTFEADYLRASRPVLVTDAALAMAASTTWSRSRFLDRVRGQMFGPQKLPVRKGALLGEARSKAGGAILTDYLAEVDHGMHKKPLAWNNPHNATLWRLLEADLSWPPSMLIPTVQRPDAGSGSFGLFMGSQGSGISMHHHKAAWNALLFGRKLWVLTPPGESKFHRTELAADSFSATGEGWLAEATRRALDITHANASVPHGSSSARGRRLYCVQRAGDVLFVPAGWGHSTLNLQESIGVANFFLDEDVMGFRPAKLFHSTRGIRSLQTAAGISAPSDMHPDGHP